MCDPLIGSSQRKPDESELRIGGYVRKTLSGCIAG